MKTEKYFKPVHPGEILLIEFLEPMKISQNKLAMEIRVPVTRISDIVHGRRAITADTALRLSKFFGMSNEFFLNLQRNYDLNEAKIALQGELTRIRQFA